MMYLLLLIAVVSVLGVLVQESYADSDYTLDAAGFGRINDKIDTASLQLFLQVPDSGTSIFVNGKISLGNNLNSIDNASISFSGNKRTVLLNAETKNYSITASGKMILSSGDNSVYRLSGETSDGSTFSTLARLKPYLTEPAVFESTTAKKDLLLLIKHTQRVEWKSPYKFTARTLDPKANTSPDFAASSGYLEGINISATVTNSLGDIIKTSNGKTSKFGYYNDSVIIPDNARTGIYRLTVVASGDGYQSMTREFTFVVNPLNTRPT
jgi:hypothetical protein